MDPAWKNAASREAAILALREQVADYLFGGPRVQNNFRSILVECMVANALGPDWAHTREWASEDLMHRATRTRLEVKQSAARQSWESRSPAPPRFDIARRQRGWDEQTQSRIDHPERASIYVFAWHPVTDDSADHRDVLQWRFYVVEAARLPAGGKTLGLGPLTRLAAPVSALDLAAEVSCLMESLLAPQAAPVLPLT